MLSKSKQIENLLVAQAMFQELPARRIDVSLFSNGVLRQIAQAGKPLHTCGAIGCFGGWIAVHPHFQKQGVFPDSDGVPRLNDLHVEALSRHLFGRDSMFSGYKWAAGEGASSRTEVLARIKVALEELTG